MITFYFISDLLVDVIGEGQGNVIAYNPQTGVTGSICGDYWSITNVSPSLEKNTEIFLHLNQCAITDGLWKI